MIHEANLIVHYVALEGLCVTTRSFNDVKTSFLLTSLLQSCNQTNYTYNKSVRKEAVYHAPTFREDCCTCIEIWQNRSSQSLKKQYPEAIYDDYEIRYFLSFVSDEMKYKKDTVKSSAISSLFCMQCKRMSDEDHRSPFNPASKKYH